MAKTKAFRGKIGRLTAAAAVTQEIFQEESTSQRGTRTLLTPEQRRENILASKRKWYHANKDRQTAWRQANPEKVKTYKANFLKKRQAQGLSTKTGDPLQVVTGSIYIAQSGDRYKIGRTNDATRRGYSLNTHSPFPVTIIYESHDIQGVNFVETALHKKYADKQVHGEWFTLNKTNVKNIKTIVNKITTADHTITV